MVWISKTLVATALLLSVCSTLSVYPHQLAYFNEVAGGPENGYQHLLHSNLDWGQGFVDVNRWLTANASCRPVYVVSHDLATVGCVTSASVELIDPGDLHLLMRDESNHNSWVVVSDFDLLASKRFEHRPYEFHKAGNAELTAVDLVAGVYRVYRLRFRSSRSARPGVSL